MSDKVEVSLNDALTSPPGFTSIWRGTAHVADLNVALSTYEHDKALFLASEELADALARLLHETDNGQQPAGADAVNAARIALKKANRG